MRALPHASIFQLSWGKALMQAELLSVPKYQYPTPMPSQTDNKYGYSRMREHGDLEWTGLWEAPFGGGSPNGTQTKRCGTRFGSMHELSAQPNNSMDWRNSSMDCTEDYGRHSRYRGCVCGPTYGGPSQPHFGNRTTSYKQHFYGLFEGIRGKVL